MIQVQSLFKSFETKTGRLQVLSNVSFQTNRGETLCIVGPSGSGKTTLLQIIAGLSPADKGTVHLHAERPQQPPAAMVFQDASLFPWLCVEKNISFAAKNSRQTDTSIRTSELLVQTGLTPFARFFPHELSAGMQQRVALARALAANPSILLLDEPFGALDYLTRIQMQQFLSNLLTHTPKTTLLVTHDIEEAIFLGDRIIVLGPRPAQVITSLCVPFSKPRRQDIRHSDAFTSLKQHLTRLLVNSAKPH